MAIKLGDALVMIGGDRSKLKGDFNKAEQDTRSWVPKIGGILERTLGGLLQSTIQGLTGMVKKFGAALLGTVTQAAKVTAVTNTFERLVEVVGGDAVLAMEDLRFATRGMVSDADLMAATNKFLSMGIATTTDEAAKLSEIATQLGTAMGEDATASMENFALMMANQSIPRLDSFGISSGAVRTKITALMEATEGMTREQAFNIAVMEEAEIAMKKVGEQGDTAAASLNKIDAGWKNITQSLGSLFLPIAERILGWFGSFLTYLSEVFTSGDTLNDYLTKLPEFLQPVAQALGNAVVFLKENLIPAIELLFGAFEKLLGGDVSGFFWGVHDALVALGIPEETLVKLEEILLTLWSAFKDLRDGDIEEFIGKIKAVLLELGVPIETIDKLEKAFRSVYTWLSENIPKAETIIKGIWKDVLKPALDGLLELVKDLLPAALIILGTILLINFVGPMILAALPVIALGLALVALGLIWNEYGDQVKVTLAQMGTIIAHIFGQAIGWVMSLMEALLSIPGAEQLLPGMRDSIDDLERMRDTMREIAEEQANIAIEAARTAKTPSVNPLEELLKMFGGLGVQDNRQNNTVYGGIQQYGPGVTDQPLSDLWSQGLAG